jgi:hypothetical protein
VIARILGRKFSSPHFHLLLLGEREEAFGLCKAAFSIFLIYVLLSVNLDVLPNLSLNEPGTHMVYEIEEANRPRSFSDFLSDGLTITQAVAPYFAGIYDWYFLHGSRDVGLEA